MAPQASESLSGLVLFVLMAALVLAAPLLFALPILYRRAVVRGMRRSSGAPAAADAGAPPEGAEPVQGAARGPLEIVRLDARSPIELGGEAALRFRQAWRGPLREAVRYAAAGIAYAAAMAFAWSAASGTPGGPVRIATLTAIFAWPACLVFLVVARPGRATGLAAIGAYGTVTAAIFALALATNEELGLGQLLLLWALMNGLASVLFVVLLRPRLRTVGPLVLPVVLLAVSGSQGLIAVLASSDDRLRGAVDVASRLGLGALGTFTAVLLAGAVAALPVGAGLLWWIRRSYGRKTTSDRRIFLSSLCLLFAVSQSFTLVVGGAAWLLLAPLAFFVWWTATRGLERFAAAPPQEGTRLLLLRVFALGRRSERLFARLEAHWRLVGSIQMIAGPDLALRTLEPHELIAFVTGRLRHFFVDDLDALERRVAGLDLRPDRDGRFRVNDLLCREDTWRPTLARLVRESDAVLMDLRGFGPAHAGCRHELHELVARVPLSRVVLVIDAATDERFLEGVLAEAWRALPVDSPNRRDGGALVTRLAMLRAGGGDADLPQLLRCLCAAAGKA